MRFIFKKVFIFYFLFTNIVYSQKSNNKLDNLSYDKLKTIYFNVSKTDFEKNLLANTFIKKGIKEKNKIGIARGYYYLGLLYYENNPKRAIKYLDSVIKYSINSNDKSFPQNAYREKAYLLRRIYKYDEAIQNYILAENIVKNTNLDFYYKIKLDIAELKSEELGDVDEALSIYKQCYKYYKTKDLKNTDYSYCYNQTLFDLADAFKAIQAVDSSTYYNRLGYQNSVITKNEEAKYLFVLNEGANLILKKKYTIAIDSLKKALPKMIEYKNKINILAGYYYLGKVNENIGNKVAALKNYITVDSVYQKEQIIYPEFTDGYDFLIEHYKTIGNKELQLKYLNTLMCIDSSNQKKYKKLDKIIRKKYEIPNLLKNKESLIQSLKGKNAFAFWIASILTVLALFLFFYIIHQRQTTKKYKLRFEKIIADSKESATEILYNEIKTEVKKQKKQSIGIGDDVVEQIMHKLSVFEKQKGYLNPIVSIQFISKEFETNTRYLSKIVNEFKEKSFSQYINDLRIDYAVKILQENNKLRKYSINALANEFGFNNAESFSTAFFKQTGIKPSFFIKELESYKSVI
ncbi:MAG: AraC family transcriptional regulator [Flavobacterium sp.]|uniref:AraC family transcriptional regulator n=1 Tax=Flavobacterium sp. TaxID=239 RepID=UPI00326752FA